MVHVIDGPSRNVAWTRAKRALIVVGDNQTLEANQMWQKAIKSCSRVSIEIPESS